MSNLGIDIEAVKKWLIGLLSDDSMSADEKIILLNIMIDNYDLSKKDAEDLGLLKAQLLLENILTSDD